MLPRLRVACLGFNQVLRLRPWHVVAAQGLARVRQRLGNCNPVSEWVGGWVRAWVIGWVSGYYFYMFGVLVG